MRIVIDMQGAQTESRYRGIGRYTVAFVKAVLRNCGEHEVILLLNGCFADTIEPLRAEFDGLISQENIRLWYAVGRDYDSVQAQRANRKISELIREAFIASLQPDVVHISSIFEGYADDAVVSVGRMMHSSPVTCVLYDLIPLLNPAEYFQPNPGYRNFYETQLEYLKKSDLTLAISSHTRQEGIRHLGIDERDIVNISAATSPAFVPLSIDPGTVRLLYKRLGIVRRFILYTGDADERKNLPRLIQAYARLPRDLRSEHQLIFAGRIAEHRIQQLIGIARESGLHPDELRFTGYLTDNELRQLYNLCTLYVFPSWHEGFGLPVLEAMACGAAVIASNTSSLPEVVGLDEAMFDPFDVDDILRLLVHALRNEDFLQSLRQHGIQQAKKFSWDETAIRAIRAWERLQKRRGIARCLTADDGGKPRLAYVSPLPPERTGIADYSAALLPELVQHYDIDIIVAQENVTEAGSEKFGRIRNSDWLRANATEFDRVLYQFGNSPFHSHMLELLKEIPGTVVLHDFFSSGLLSWMEPISGAWSKALYESHGYTALRKKEADPTDTIKMYPANWHIYQHARGIIVHSRYSLRLSKYWYGGMVRMPCEEIPLLRTPPVHIDKLNARVELGLDPDIFLVCSFGFLDETKLNHRLLEVWLKSEMSQDENAFLYFVGENHQGAYGRTLLNTIRESPTGHRVKITGFASKKEFELFLSAADVAVQLRTDSRGETSAAVLDCKNHSLPVIVNANGSMAELDTNAVWMLPDDFSDAELLDALQSLSQDAQKRQILGKRAKEVISTKHSPAHCAKRYAEAIEKFYRRTECHFTALIPEIATHIETGVDDAFLLQLSELLAINFPLPRPAKRFFLDITATLRHDLKTGIERVARALTITLLEMPPAGYRIEPIYLAENNGVWQHKYARHYTLNALRCPSGVLDDDPVDVQNGDVMLILDISGSALVNAAREGIFSFYRNVGVAVYSVVYDLLPITMPNAFPPGATATHAEWVDTITRFDGAICISQSVAEDLKAWLRERGEETSNRRPYRVEWWHLGADVDKSLPSMGLPKDAKQVLREVRSRPTFLMVGTIEPRKAHLQVIEAFDLLWAEGKAINLVIIGKEGWVGLPDSDRRNIPLTINRISRHPELGSKLKWLQGASDEYLTSVYEASSCLIAASYGEGFGLPLIEAAQHKLPILARDIPVFREVAGEHAYYFDGSTPAQLADAIRDWLKLYDADAHPRSDNMPWLTWKESAAQLLSKVLNNKQEAASVATNS